MKMVVLSLLVALAFGCTGIMSASEPSAKPLFEDSFEVVGENGLPNGWTIFSGTGGAISSDMVRSGKQSLFMDDPSKEISIGLRSPQVPAVAGKDYTISTWAYAVSGAATIYIEFWDEAGKRLSPSSARTTVNNEWELVELTKTAPDGAKFVSMIAYAVKTNVGSHYFDDVRIAAAN